MWPRAVSTFARVDCATAGRGDAAHSVEPLIGQAGRVLRGPRARASHEPVTCVGNAFVDRAVVALGGAERVSRAGMGAFHERDQVVISADYQYAERVIDVRRTRIINKVVSLRDRRGQPGPDSNVDVAGDRCFYHRRRASDVSRIAAFDPRVAERSEFDQQRSRCSAGSTSDPLTVTGVFWSGFVLAR